MAVSRAQKMAKEKYRSEKRDQMTIEVPKGKRNAYKAIAAELGISLSMLIQNGVESLAGRCMGEDFTAAIKPEAEKLTTEQKRLVEEFNQLPVDAQKYLIKFVRAINDQSKGGGNNGDN